MVTKTYRATITNKAGFFISEKVIIGIVKSIDFLHTDIKVTEIKTRDVKGQKIIIIFEKTLTEREINEASITAVGATIFVGAVIAILGLTGLVVWKIEEVGPVIKTVAVAGTKAIFNLALFAGAVALALIATKVKPI